MTVPPRYEVVARIHRPGRVEHDVFEPRMATHGLRVTRDVSRNGHPPACAKGWTAQRNGSTPDPEHEFA
jgi:hypothetical protein